MRNTMSVIVRFDSVDFQFKNSKTETKMKRTLFISTMAAFLAYMLIFSTACSRPVGAYLIAVVFPPSVVEIGDNMVDSRLLDINGNRKRLAYFMSDKYLLLNFGGRCGHFIASLPELSKVAEMYSEKLTLIVINVDRKAQWRELMTQHHIPGINLHDPKTWRGLVFKYGANFTIPHYVIISPEGKVVDRWTGFSDGIIREKVSERLGCALAAIDYVSLRRTLFLRLANSVCALSFLSSDNPYEISKIKFLNNQEI